MSDPEGKKELPSKFPARLPERDAPRWEDGDLVETTSPFRGGLARFASGEPIQAGIAAIFGAALEPCSDQPARSRILV